MLSIISVFPALWLMTPPTAWFTPAYPKEQITVLPTNDDATIVAELAKYSCPNIYLITWLYKYKSLEKYLIEHEGEKDSTPSTAV